MDHSGQATSLNTFLCRCLTLAPSPSRALSAHSGHHQLDRRTHLFDLLPDFQPQTRFYRKGAYKCRVIFKSSIFTDTMFSTKLQRMFNKGRCVVEYLFPKLGAHLVSTLPHLKTNYLARHLDTQQKTERASSMGN